MSELDHNGQQALRRQVGSLSEQLAQSYEELSLVYGLAERMTVGKPAADFLAEACAEAADVLTARMVGVFAWGETLGRLPPTTFGEIGLGDADVERLGVALRDLLADAASRGESHFRDNEAHAVESLSWLPPRGRQVLAVPIRRGGSLAGCVFAVDKDVPAERFGEYNDGAFTSIDRKLLAGVATQVGVFLENRRLYDDAERLMMGLLHTMVAAIDAKDAYTRGHSVRVALFARRLAAAAGMTADEQERVYLSGLLHDVGKIGVDDAVIRKPGKLDDDEFAQIKRHPQIGHRILGRVPNIDDVLPGVLYHHEKYDGRGYPEGLAGAEIPRLGRLLCVADSFDAMTSSRTYRVAMPIETALAEVRRCAGTQFDPEYARLFCEIGETEFRRLIDEERGGVSLPGPSPVTLAAAA